jgi:hypothetical protein
MKRLGCIRCDEVGDREHMRPLYVDPCDPDGDNAEPRFWLCPACADHVTAAELRRAAEGMARLAGDLKGGRVIDIAKMRGLPRFAEAGDAAAASATALGKARRALTNEEGPATP